MCVQNVFDIYTKTTPNRSTQVIFCDMSTPKADSRQDRFEIYRPDKSKVSGFDLVRKKIGLGSGDEDSPKRISSFPDIKAYVDKLYLLVLLMITEHLTTLEEQLKIIMYSLLISAGE